MGKVQLNLAELSLVDCHTIEIREIEECDVLLVFRVRRQRAVESERRVVPVQQKALAVLRRDPARAVPRLSALVSMRLDASYDLCSKLGSKLIFFGTKLWQF